MKEPRQKELEELAEECMVLEEHMHILEAENSILYHEKEVSSPVLLEEFRSKNMALEARLANANREKVAV